MNVPEREYLKCYYLRGCVVCGCKFLCACKHTCTHKRVLLIPLYPSLHWQRLYLLMTYSIQIEYYSWAKKKLHDLDFFHEN